MKVINYFKYFNTKTLRNGKIRVTKQENSSKFFQNTFDYFSNSFFKCLNLNLFEEKLGTFNTWLNNNMIYVFKYFAENFPNFDLALKNLYMYKSVKKT